MTAPAGRKNGRYATKLGGKHTAPSVTAVLGVLDKPGLPWGAAKETALFAIHHQDEWLDLAPPDAYERLRKHHKGVWNDKANVGTLVHDLALGWAQGRAVDCPPRCDPYMDALERFYLDWRPVIVEAERSVFYDHPDLGYGGSFDLIATVADSRTLLIDYKTGDRVWPEVKAQLAAYRHAPTMGVYDESGALVDSQPTPKVDGAAVLHLHDDGTYALIEVAAGRAEWDFFLACRRVWSVWSKWSGDNGWPPAPLAAPQRQGAIAS
jgi:hypothetical protein